MEFNWSYLWAALVVNFLLVYLVPRLIQKPTGIQVIDDIVLFLKFSEGFFARVVYCCRNSLTYLAHYWVDSQTGAQT
jgi:hypothetical protein